MVLLELQRDPDYFTVFSGLVKTVLRLLVRRFIGLLDFTTRVITLTRREMI